MSQFWGSLQCGPCESEIPGFTKLEEAYKARGFAVLGISMDDDGWKVVKPYLSAHHVSYRVALGTEKVAQLYGGVDSLPVTLLLDQSGRVAYSHTGLVDQSEYQTEILQLLNAAAPAAL